MSLSVRNDGNVSESNAAMLVLVTLEGYLETDVTVTVQTRDGTGTCTYVYGVKEKSLGFSPIRHTLVVCVSSCEWRGLQRSDT